MNWTTQLVMALRAIHANSLRSALSMLSIVVGVAAVITMISIGVGARAQVEDQVTALGASLMTVVPGSVTSGGVRLGTGARASLTEDDAYAMQREVPQVKGVAPTLRGSVHVVHESRNWLTSFHGSTEDFFDVRNWRIAAGRAFSAQEMAGAAKVLILGATVADQLFGESDPVGRVVRARNVPMEVIGVLEAKGRTLQGGDYDDMILVPITTARKRLQGANYTRLHSVHYISLKGREGADIAALREDLRLLLRQRHQLSSGDTDDFKIFRSWDVVAAHAESARALSVLLAAGALISLLVAGIGIMNVMLVSVGERTREIGIRMAVGAKRSDICLQFLIEAVTLAMISGLLGALLGIGAVHAIGQLAGWRTVLDSWMLVLGIGFSGMLGVVFGVYPAYKASRLSPSGALNLE